MHAARQSLLKAIQSIPGEQGLAVAVSGGGDSLALLALLSELNTTRPIYAMIVDHGLQAGSNDVAHFAAQQARRMGAQPIILTWHHGPLSGNIPAQARRARYGLMGDACRGRGIDYLFVGHHRDDQLETLMMREDAGFADPAAGLMKDRSYAPVWPELRGITLIRPLLKFSRDVLRAYVKERGLKFHSDPANRNPVYSRARTRLFLASHPPRREALDTTLRKVDIAQSPLLGWFKKIEMLRGGAFKIDVGLFGEKADAETLGKLIACASGQETGPAQTPLARALERLSEGAVRLTLGGADIQRNEDGHIFIARETGRWLKTMDPDETTLEPIVFDGRYDILPEKAGMSIAPLWRHREQLDPAMRAALQTTPAGRRALPGLFDGEKLVTAPHLEFSKTRVKDLARGRFLRQPWSSQKVQ